MTSHHTKMAFRFAVFLASSFLLTTIAEAYSFAPTETEFASWPNYCKGAYVYNTTIGGGSKYVAQVGRPQLDAFNERANDGTRGLHHACAGMIWLNRASREEADRDRQYMLVQALRETQFSFARSNMRSRFFGDVAIQKAMIQYEIGEAEQAIATLRELIRHQTKNPIPYSATAVLLRKLGRLVDAKQILLVGDEAVDGQSAEIKYNLGLIALELGEISQAESYADSAYQLGYPLPGLRNKLDAATESSPN